MYINYTSDVIRKNECGIARYEKHAFATSLILHIGSEIGAFGGKYHNTVLSIVQSCICYTDMNYMYIESTFFLLRLSPIKLFVEN